jgi:hypothetical protein
MPTARKERHEPTLPSGPTSTVVEIWPEAGGCSDHAHGAKQAFNRRPSLVATSTLPQRLRIRFCSRYCTSPLKPVCSSSTSWAQFLGNVVQQAQAPKYAGAIWDLLLAPGRRSGGYGQAKEPASGRAPPPSTGWHLARVRRSEDFARPPGARISALPSAAPRRPGTG